MSDELKISLRKICESSYYKEYNFIRVSNIDVSFWLGEVIEYSLVYTENLKKTKKTIKKYSSDEATFRRINKYWYEYRPPHHI